MFESVLFPSLEEFRQRLKQSLLEDFAPDPELGIGEEQKEVIISILLAILLPSKAVLREIRKELLAEIPAERPDRVEVIDESIVAAILVKLDDAELIHNAYITSNHLDLKDIPNV